jgi:hypothetical protein
MVGDAFLTVAVLLGTIVLAGCTPMAMAATPSASPPPAPMSVPSAGASAPSAPAQVLDGDCSALFPEAVLSSETVTEVLGASVAEQNLFLDAPNLQAVPTLGGLDCRWRSAGGFSSAASVTAVVLASSLVGDRPDTVTCAPDALTDAESTNACRFDFTAGGLWLSGHLVPQRGSSESDTRAAVITLRDALRALPAATTGAAGQPAPLPDGAWRPPACADLSDAAAVTRTLDDPGLAAMDVQTSGAESVPGVHAANGAAGVFACAWLPSGEVAAGAVDGFSVLALPGGRWAETLALAVPGADVIDVPGADLAVRMPTADGHDLIDVFDGVNWMQLGGAGTLDAVLPVVPGLIDALDAERAH